jgi:hypothetical protein
MTLPVIARQFYETARDRVRERAIANEVGAVWGCCFVQNKPGFAADLCAVRDGHVIGLAEVRERPRHSLEVLDGWGGVFFSLQKWSNIHGLTLSSGLPFVFILKAAGVLHFHATRTFDHDGVDIGGRTDRGDWQDVEPVALLRAHRFRLIR